MTTNQNKTLAQLIVEWSASRPAWQQKVLHRAAKGEILSAADYDQLVTEILDPTGSPIIRLKVADFPQTASNLQVRLISITEAEHVNALASGQKLIFGAEGLTIVYGDNGSGKSGYGRVLKNVARSRHSGEKILTNVFEDTPLDSPTAKLCVEVGGQVKMLSWPSSNLSDLQRMLFYDGSCGTDYVSTESEFIYMPSILAVRDALIEACKAVQVRIEAKLTEIDDPKNKEQLPLVEDNIKETEAGKFVLRLSAGQLSENTSKEKLSSLIAQFDTANGNDTIDDLRKQESQLQNAKSERSAVINRTGKLQALQENLGKVDKVIGDVGLGELKKLQGKIANLQRESDSLAKSFKNEPLPGAGTEEWKRLWETARHFSEKYAYPEDVFPFTDENSCCVLCHQKLDDDARSRFERFEKFAKDDIQIRLNQAKDGYRKQIQEIQGLDAKLNEMKSHTEDLKETHKDLVNEISELLEGYENTKNETVKAIENGTPIKLFNIDTTAMLTKITQAVKDAQKSAEELGDPESVQRKLKEVITHRQELELLQKIKNSRDPIIKEFGRLERRRILVDAKQDASTTQITIKFKDLLQAGTTSAIQAAFEDEKKQLQLDRVNIEMNRAERGKLFHQPKLEGAQQNVALNRVFSEGEKTALGLAALFTETQLDTSKSTLILDDPVNSLSHTRRKIVAKRISELSKERQVILFTHDVVFVTELKYWAEKNNVKVTNRSIEQSHDEQPKPGKCYNHHPWTTRYIKERFDFLDEDLARIKAEKANWDNIEYENNVSRWAGHLSETWERIIRYEVAGPLLNKDGIEVHPRLLRTIVYFSEDDFYKFEDSYKKTSIWSRRHDNAPATNYSPPKIADLEQELRLVKNWVKSVRAYQNKKSPKVKNDYQLKFDQFDIDADLRSTSKNV